MTAYEPSIFGNGALHERFCATTDLLAKLVASAPRPMTLPQLQRATGRDARPLARLCAELSQEGLIIANAVGAWQLARDPAAVTLDDVYRCVLAQETQRSRPAGKATEHHANHAVDLLLMQAALAINQSVRQHLRQFSLDRLKPASAPFPVGRRARASLHYDGGSLRDFSFEVSPDVATLAA